MCPSGNRGGKIQVKDGIMTLSFPGGYPGPFWTAKLAADGSFDAVVESPLFRGGTRVTVPAGTGPREIKTMRQTQVCGYRMIPD